jgi:hypothetical protein
MKKKPVENCETCKKWKTSRCSERKQSGRDSGPGDWCFGFKTTGNK